MNDDIHELFEIRLADYRCLRYSEQGTRLAVREVIRDESTTFTLPMDGTIEQRERLLAEMTSISSTLEPARIRRDRTYAFIGSPEMRGDRTNVIIELPESDSRQWDDFIDHVTIQTSTMFDLIKPHSLNQGAVDLFLDKLEGYEPSTGDELKQLIRDVFQQYTQLHGTMSRGKIMLSGVTNLKTVYKLYCSPFGREVRDPAFLIDGTNINGTRQNGSDYKDVLLTTCQSRRLFLSANLFHLPWIFFNPADGGMKFSEQALREAQTPADRDWNSRATDSMLFTPLPSSGLPNDERFWLKTPGAMPVSPSWYVQRELHLSESARENTDHWERHRLRQERLRADARAFVEKICTEEILERAWYTCMKDMPLNQPLTRDVVPGFLRALHMLERSVIDGEESTTVDWTKVYPRVDRLAKSWVLARLEPEETGRDEDCDDDDWVVLDEDHALESSLSLRM